MRHLFIIIFCVLASIACNQVPKYNLQGKNAIQFILDSSDLRLLLDSMCLKTFDINSFRSISEYDSARKTYYTNMNKLYNNTCLCFNFMDSTTFPSKQICIPIIARSYGLVATTVPNHSVLIISTSHSNMIQTVKGNEFYYGNQPVDSLNKYVKNLFLNPPDTNRYSEKFINLQFTNDSLFFANKLLTQLLIGYIKAQRELCQLKFGKLLRYASPKEIQALRRAAPLRFKLTKIMYDS